MKNYYMSVYRRFGYLTVTLLALLAPAVMAVPVIVVPPHDITAPINTVTNLSVTATGVSLSYRWRQNGNVTGPNTSSLTFSPVADSQAGTYTVVVQDGTGGTVTNGPVIFRVIHPPVISSQPESQVVLADDGVFFSVQVNGALPFQFQWYKNGVGIPGETLTSLELGFTSAADAGSYAVAITNLDGTASSANALLSVVQQRLISSQPLDAPVNKCSALTLTADVAGAGDILHYHWSHNGNAVGTDSPTYTVSASLDYSDAGSYAVVITNNSVDGEPVEVQTHVTVVDPFPVITGCPDNISVNTDIPSAICGKAVSWTLPQATDNCSVTNFTSDHQSGDIFPIGTTTVTYTAIDDAGQSTNCSFTVTVTDVTPPVVVAKNITVNLDVTGNASIVAADVDNGTSDACGLASLTVAPTTFNCGNVGPNIVTLTAVDVNGNTSSAPATVTIHDVTPPAVVTHDISINLDHSGNATITTNDINNGSSDACGIATMSVNPSSFTSANIGNNTVTLTVTDVNGNTSSAPATVTVSDNTPPDVSVHDITVQLDATGHVTITAADVDNGSSDAGGIVSSNVSPSSFTCSDVGSSHTVTLTVTDNSGNHSSSTAQVTVQDSIAPAITFNPITVQLDTNGDYTFTADDVNTLSAGTSDACGVQSITVSPLAVNFTDVGSKSVTLTATDNNGNVSTSTGTITVLAPIGQPPVVYVDASYGSSGLVVFPNTTGTGHYYIGYNAFATIQAAVNAVADNGTVNVASGTYAENVEVGKGVLLRGPNAGIQGNSPSRVPEAIITSAVTGPDVNTDDIAVLEILTNNVTVDGFTVDGDNLNLTGGAFAGTNDIDAAEGIVAYHNSSQTHIINNIVKNLTYAGVDFDNYIDGAASSDNFIQNNYFTNIRNTDYLFGLGVLVQDNCYADVSTNTMDLVRVGIQTGNFFRANPGSTASIHDNTLSVGGSGIYHNLAYLAASPFTIINNTITSYDEGVAGLWRGLLVKTLQNNITATVSNNTISSGAITRTPVGYMFWGDSTAAGVTISGGSVSGMTYGAWLNNFEGDGHTGTGATVTLSGVQISGSTGAGVYVKDSALSSNHDPLHVTLQNCLITNSAIGLLVDGSAASLTPNDAIITGATSYIVLTNASSTGMDATSVVFDGLIGSTATDSQLFAIEDKITHKVDNAALGFVQVKTANVYVTANGGSIQRAVDAANPGDTVNVNSGVYAENVEVGKGVLLRGPNAGIPGNSPSRVPEAIITTAVTGPDVNTDDIAVLEILTNNVTVDGFTVDGDNLNLTEGAVVGTNNVDAAEGIVAYHNSSQTHIINNIVKNLTYAGVDFDNYIDAHTASSDNFIQNNYFTNLRNTDFLYGIGVLVQDNCYAEVSSNAMDLVRVGVQTGNFFIPNSGATASIHDNTLSVGGSGIYHNLAYGTASPFTIVNNTITSYDEGVAGIWRGLLVKTLQNNITATVANNTISSGAITRTPVGYMFWGDSTSAGVTISGGTVSGMTYGAWLNNYEGDDHTGTGATVNLSGVQISGSTGAGVYVKDSTLSSNHDPLHVNLQNCLITNSAIGLLVDGPAASLTPNDTIITGATSYIVLTNASSTGMDATGVAFDGLFGNTATDAQLFAIEDKITHKVDNDTLGFVQVKTTNVYVTINGGSIQRGINAAGSGDTVHVNSGTYPEHVNINKSLTLRGANAGIPGFSTNRVPETVIVPVVTGPSVYEDDTEVVYISTNNVTIDGFTVSGDNFNLTGGVLVGTNDVDAAEGIVSYEGVSGTHIINNIVRDVTYAGLDFDNSNPPYTPTSDNFFQNNRFTNIGSLPLRYGIGVLVLENFYADISTNTFDLVRVGIQTGNFNGANPGATAGIYSNTISAGSSGIYHNLAFNNASPFSIINNTITSYDEGTNTYWRGLLIKTLQNNVTTTVASNTISSGAITGTPVGYMVWGDSTTAGVTISGGSVSGMTYGVWLNNFEGDEHTGTGVALTLDRVRIFGATGAGVYVKDSALSSNHDPLSLVLQNGCLITNAVLGVLVDGAAASAVLNNTGLNASEYIVLTNNAATGIDATQVRFNGTRGSFATLNTLYGIEDRIQHKVDDISLGFVRVKATNVYVTANSFVLPNTVGPDIQRGLNSAGPGDVVNVTAGTFTNNLVIIQPVMLQGANLGNDAQTGSPRSAETIIDGQNLDGAVAVNASSVTVDGFTIRNGAGGTFNAGVALAPGTQDQHIRDNIITQNAYGLTAGSTGADYIRNNLFSGNTLAAIDAPATTVNFAIHDNEFTGQSTPNVISLEAAGAGAHTGLQIYQNNIHDNNGANAIYALGISSGSIYENNITAPNATGISLSGLNQGVTILNNKFFNALRGVTVEDASVFQAPSPNSGIVIHNNSFTGFTSPTAEGLYAVGNLPGGDSDAILDATTNWWGNASGAYSTSLNPYGTGGGVTDNVKISPWLGSGTDTSFAIGFQPVGNSLNTPPTHLVFTRQPGDANLGSAFFPQPIVTVRDANNHTTPWANPPVTMVIGSNPNQGVLNGTNPQSGSGGSVTFSGLNITVGGGFNYTLIASAPGLAPATSQGFDIRNPDPTVSSLAPYWTRAGSGAFSLTVFGTKFVPNSVVRWNGSARTTHYVSATQLTADINAADVANVTTGHVSVFNPAPSGGTSSSIDFRVLPATINIAYVDDSYIGLTNDAPVNWPYTGNGTHIIGYDAFTTIQTGINTVNANGTVNVAGGTYVENVTINKTLSLLASNANRDPRIQRRTGLARGTEAVIDGNLTEAAVTILADGVIVNGFTIQNGANGTYNSGVWMYGGVANVSVLNNILTNNNIGIAAASAGTSSIGTNLFIANNAEGSPTVSAGIDGYAATTNLTIVNNEFTGHTAGNPILLEATGTNIHNGLVITRNNFHDNSNASAVYALGITGGTITRNTFTAPAATCLSFSDANNGVIVQNNFFSNADRGVRIEDAGYFSPVLTNSGIVVTGNSFTGFASPATDTFYALGNIAGGDSDAIVDASANWWGGNATNVVEVAAYGVVDYTPWLDNGTDTSTASTGFQGDFGTLHVDINSPQTGLTNRIQEGVNLATDTVLIAAGAYNENVIDSNDVSLIGTGSGVSASDVVITAIDQGSPVINLANSEGSSSHDQLLVENLRVTGSAQSGIQVLASSQSLSYIHFENVASVGNNSFFLPQTPGPFNGTGNGIALTGTRSIQNVEIVNCILDGNGNAGLFVDTNLFFVTSIDLIGGEVENNGLYGVSFNSPDGGIEFVNDLTINGTTFAYNGNPQAPEPTVQPLVHPLAPADSGDIHLVGFNGSALITNVNITVSGFTAIELAGKMTGGAHPSLSAAGNVSIKHVTISGTPEGPAVSIARYSDVRNIALSGLDLSNVTVPGETPTSVPAMMLGSIGTRHLNLNDTKFPDVPTGYYDIVITNTSGATASCDTLFIGSYTPQAQHAVVFDRNTPPGNPSLGDVIFPTFTITGPGDITQEATSAAGNNVTFAVTSVDQCDASPVITSTPASGSLFPVGTTLVTSTVVDNRGDSNTITFQVIIQDTTRPSVSCPSDLVVINDPNVTYATVNYPDLTATDNTTIDSVVYTPPSGSQFPKGTNSVHLVVTDHYGNASTCDFSVTVNDVPVITHQPTSLTRNAGESANFCVSVTGTDPFGYQWYLNGSPVSDNSHITGSTSSAISLSSVTKADAGSYTVVITNVAGVATSCVATLTVIDPFIVTQPHDVTVPLNGTTNFFVVAGGAQPLFYQWKQNGIILVGATNSALNFTQVHDSDAGTYLVIVTNSQGTITSSPALMIVKHPPFITAQPTNLFLPVGAQASFNVSANGLQPFTYQWYKNGSSMSPTGGVRKLILNNIQLSDSGSYSVYITNADGSTMSTNAILRVYDRPTITLQPLSQTNDAGTTVTFNAFATSDVPMTYLWLKNGTNMTNGANISGVLTTNLTITNVMGADGASYTLAVSNSVGVTLSDVALLTVHDPVITQQPTNAVVIQDRTATFKVKAVGTHLDYQWFVDGFPIDEETNATLNLSNVSDSDQGSYTVVVASDYGSVTSDSATLSTIPPIIIHQPQDEVVFIGDVASFDVDANGPQPLTYQWFRNNQLLDNETNRLLTFFVSSAGDSASYSVIVTTAQGSEQSRQATLLVSGSPSSLVIPVGMSNNIITLHIVGIEGLTYRLDGSTNLTDWFPVATNVSPYFYNTPATNSSEIYRSVFIDTSEH